MSDQQRVWASLAFLVAALFAASMDKPAPQPVPPTPDGPLHLRGLFVGESAAQDAAMISALSFEIADELEWDGKQAEPYMKTGAQFDALRTRAREMRVRGQSIGDRQPQVRKAVQDFLDKAVGNSGGPADAAQRERWVEAYRVIARAAEHATR